jgi:hypothetical protein
LSGESKLRNKQEQVCDAAQPSVSVDSRVQIDVIEYYRLNAERGDQHSRVC